MPTYTISNSNLTIKPKLKKEIAKEVTNIHKSITGANAYFAQVIFNKTKNNSHFMGGKKVKDPQLFLHGQIRGGRSSEQKKKLIINLRDMLVKKSKLDSSQIWVYIIDLPSSQMVEYGEILPEAGKEAQWFSNLSKKLKKKLKAIDI